jgi:3-oxocholest-4-en-26-oate---CoA ligase
MPEPDATRPGGHSFARSWRTVARLAPERVALVCGDRRVTFGGFHEAADALAGWMSDRGVGPGDKVAIQLVNSPEYMIAFFAAQLLGAVPVNVNYRYTGDEVSYLVDNSDAAVLVVHDEFADAIADAIEHHPALHVVMVDRVGSANVATATRWQDAIAEAGTHPNREPHGDDLIFVYTGGTTGYPKAVMWRSDDLAVALWQMSRPGQQPPDAESTIAKGRAAATLLPACPLMHGTGLFMALSTLSGGGTTVLLDDVRLDAAAVWDAVERESVRVVTIVGDAFARPLLNELDSTAERRDLSSLIAITSSGVTFSPECKRGLLGYLPGITIVDSLGASEGIMSRSEVKDGEAIKPATFRLSDRMVVIADDDTFIEPGDERVGMLGVGGPIPLGYYKDPAKTAATFRTVGGRRFSVPGDYATVGTDGTITLLGRGSACINTGGEKVYPEEVELRLKQHAEVFDAVVVGVPDERWGEMVVALVELAPGSSADDAMLREFCRATLAGYKVPKRVITLDSLERAPNGKADYQHLRSVAAARIEARHP